MLIQDKASFKRHLVSELKSHTEADPDVLSDYIIALVENSQITGPEFETCMISKLEDFLSGYTRMFVSHLVDKLASVGEVQKPAVEERKACHAWAQRGSCKRGSSCRFAHNINTVIKSPFHAKALLIENIPPEYCSIAAVHDHFSRFGTIVNIDLRPELKTARLEYAHGESAQAAHDSPDVIFNNRFVRLSYPSAALTIPAPPSLRKAPVVVISAQEALVRKRKETLEAYLELQRQKEALLHKYLEEEGRLLAALSNNTVDEEEKQRLLGQLRVVQEAIKAARPPEPPRQPVQPILRGGPAAKRQAPPPPPVRRKLADFKLDLRPKTIRMAPIPAKLGTDPASIRRFFEPYGQVAQLSVDGDSAFVAFVRRMDAEKAMFCLSKVEEEAKFTWEL